jgi:hypothetical protein
MKKELVKVPVNTLLESIGNPKKHPDAQIDMLCRSISEFGFTNPLLVDENNRILGGHGRLLAAKKLGMATVDCIVLRGLTEAQKKAYLIADNKIADLGEWDEDRLQDIITSLSEDDMGLLHSLGMEQDELDYFVRQLDELDTTDLLEDVGNSMSDAARILEISKSEAAQVKEKREKHCIILEFTDEHEKDAAYSELLSWGQLFNTLSIKSVNY